ncbi:MAG: hypothetical protein EBQ67_03705, partial [Sphingobacteriia bacterium]|nr:hypothetical protein [Sphingobacteriia bacterium]
GASLTQVNLQYDLSGLGYSSTPMTYSAANDRWVGTVPAGSINVPVRYRVTALDASSLVDTSLPRTYTDNYLTVFAGNDTTVTPGDTATLSATTTGFASSSMLRASTQGGNGSGGVTFNLRARNAITIDSIWYLSPVLPPLRWMFGTAQPLSAVLQALQAQVGRRL